MIRHLSRISTVVVLAAVCGVALTAAASAGPTATGTLTCGSQSYTVTGYGRGTPLHLVDGRSMYVVTYAELDGQVLVDVPGQRGRADSVTCTTTNPLTESRFTFKGFFTPR
jgi:hypothetical protein